MTIGIVDKCTIGIASFLHLITFMDAEQSNWLRGIFNVKEN
jgi:hypothetical protein